MEMLRNILLILFAVLILSCEKQEVKCDIITHKFTRSILVKEKDDYLDREHYFFVLNGKDTIITGQHSYFTKNIGDKYKYE